MCGEIDMPPQISDLETLFSHGMFETPDVDTCGVREGTHSDIYSRGSRLALRNISNTPSGQRLALINVYFDMIGWFDPDWSGALAGKKTKCCLGQSSTAGESCLHFSILGHV